MRREWVSGTVQRVPYNNTLTTPTSRACRGWCLVSVLSDLCDDFFLNKVTACGWDMSRLTEHEHDYYPAMHDCWQNQRKPFSNQATRKTRKSNTNRFRLFYFTLSSPLLMLRQNNDDNFFHHVPQTSCQLVLDLPAFRSQHEKDGILMNLKWFSQQSGVEFHWRESRSQTLES